MRAIELFECIGNYIDTGKLDADADVTFGFEDDGINDGARIEGVLALTDGTGKTRLILTDVEEVIR